MRLFNNSNSNNNNTNTTTTTTTTTTNNNNWNCSWNNYVKITQKLGLYMTNLYHYLSFTKPS